MTQTAIPVEFENYLQESIAENIAPTMNQMIFAYIPDLDIEAEIDRTQGIPDSSYWVHVQNVDQAGKINENTLVYSVVIPSSVSEFTFNAIYLHDKNVSNSCGMVVHKATETKENGMSSTKSLLQQYSGAALISNITVDAGTWQIDYHARLIGIEEDHRLTCLDSYGHTAFIDGLTVTQQTSTQYKISAGLAYIGGLRITTEEQTLNINSKPTGLYLDVYRDGSELSTWENNLTITQSASTISDYTDANGKAHYVAKLATINADGSITDHKVEQTGELERADNSATNADIDAESTVEKHVKLEQMWRAINAKIDTLTEQIEKERVSVGEIIEITGVSTNPATLKGYGTWQSFGAGRVTVGVGSATDSRAESKTWTDGQSEGEFKHLQTEAELAIHGHNDDISVTIENGGAHDHDVDYNEAVNEGGSSLAGYNQVGGAHSKKTGVSPEHAHNAVVNGGVQSAGSSSPMNNIQPSIAVYRWKRTA